MCVRVLKDWWFQIVGECEEWDEKDKESGGDWIDIFIRWRTEVINQIGLRRLLEIVQLIPL